MESDLTRVESQVDLILDNAAMQGKPQTISTDLELASDLVSGGMFGDAESAVADLDRDTGTRVVTKTANPEPRDEFAVGEIIRAAPQAISRASCLGAHARRVL